MFRNNYNLCINHKGGGKDGEESGDVRIGNFV